MNTPNENDIIEALKTDRYSPSKEWKARTLQKLCDISSREHSWAQSFSDLFFNFKAIAALATAVIVLIAGNAVYNNPALRVQRHLKNASYALEQLERYTRGEPVSTIQSVMAVNIVPAAHALSPTTESVESVVRELVQTVVTETERAIQSASEIGAPVKTAKVLSQISEIQNTFVKTLSSVIKVTQSAETASAAKAAIKITAAEQTHVKRAIDIANQAVAAGSAKVKIVVPTGSELAKLSDKTEPVTSEQAKEQLKSDQELLEKNKAPETGVKEAEPEQKKSEDKKDAGKNGDKNSSDTLTPAGTSTVGESNGPATQVKTSDSESPQISNAFSEIKEQADNAIANIQKAFDNVKSRFAGVEFDLTQEFADIQAQIDASKANYDKAVTAAQAGKEKEAFDILGNDFFPAIDEARQSIDMLDGVSNLMRAAKQMDSALNDAEEIIAKRAENGMDTSKLEEIVTKFKAEAEAFKASLRVKPLEPTNATNHIDVLNGLRKDFENEIKEQSVPEESEERGEQNRVPPLTQ